jgi:hypothetical protein
MAKQRLDYCYTSEKEYPWERDVYHVLFRCPDVKLIKKEHREYKRPPVSERRRPCKACLKQIGNWLESVDVSHQPTWFHARQTP